MTKTNETIEIKNAETLMLTLLRRQTNRLNHTLQVVKNAEKLATKYSLTQEEENILIQSAYLHDIGYSDNINFIKFHPYDGFSYTQRLNTPEEVALLILYHSYSDILINLENNKELKKFYTQHPLPKKLEKLLYILTLADFTSDSKGNEVTLDYRVQDIIDRYGKTSSIGKHAKIVANILKEGIPNN